MAPPPVRERTRRRASERYGVAGHALAGCARVALLRAIAKAAAQGQDPRPFCEGDKLIREADASETLADRASDGS